MARTEGIRVHTQLWHLKKHKTRKDFFKSKRNRFGLHDINHWPKRRWQKYIGRGGYDQLTSQGSTNPIFFKISYREFKETVPIIYVLENVQDQQDGPMLNQNNCSRLHNLLHLFLCKMAQNMLLKESMTAKMKMALL